MSAAISDDAGIDELLARMRVNADKFNAAFITLMELVDGDAATTFQVISRIGQLEAHESARLGTAEQDAPGVGVNRRLRDRLKFINWHIALVEANRGKPGLSSRERQMILYAERDESDFLTALIGDMQ